MTLTKKLAITGLGIIMGLSTGCERRPIEESTFSGTYALKSFGQELNFNYKQKNGERVKIDFRDGERKYTFFDKNGSNSIDEQGDYVKIEGPGYSGTITPAGTKTTGNFPTYILSKNDQKDLKKASETLRIMRYTAIEAEKGTNPRNKQSLK